MRDEFGTFSGNTEDISKIRELYDTLCDELFDIDGLDRNSRELSIVKSRLEEACMYSIKCHCKNRY